MMSTTTNKKRRIRYDNHTAAAPRGPDLPRGVPGLLVTCATGKEKQCVREVFNLLDECCSSTKTPEDEKEGDHSSSISKKLEQELEELRDQSKSKYRQFRYLGVNGIIFIQFFIENGAPKPLDAALAIFKHIEETKSCKARWTIRLLPIETSCYVSLEDIDKVAATMVKDHFPCAPSSDDTDQKDKDNNNNPPNNNQKFAVEYEHRASKKLERLSVINLFTNKIKQPPYSVDLKNPNRSIIVQFVKSTCFIGIASDYRKLLKYNLQMIIQKHTE